MPDSNEIIGQLLKLTKSKIEEIQDYQVLIGFSGFGNVGYLALTHLVEELELSSISFWGHSSWYYRGNLESLLTVYQHKPSKTIIVLSRLPIHVSTVPQQFWDRLVQEILLWNCKKFIVVGGLREETRSLQSRDWAAFAPTPKWTELFETPRTFGDKLAMIGPLSSFLVYGTSFESPVLGLLAYCNFEEDPEAALIAVREIDKLCKLSLSNTDSLLRFDYSFIPGGLLPNAMMNMAEDELDELDELDDDEDDFTGYDLGDLI